MTGPRLTSSLALLALALGALTGLLALLGPLGSRWGWWHFRTGFGFLLAATLTGLAALGLGVIAAFLTRQDAPRGGVAWAATGAALGLMVTAVLVSWAWRARSAPAIHDITTDTDDPPRFVAILPLRQHAPNSAAYGGPEIAAQQRAAYPEVRPETLGTPTGEAFERALAAARDMGWKMVAAEPQEGRIEATATTTWFGFQDDIVIRISPANGDSRVDIRSASRVGVSDVGTNARRVRKFLKKLRSHAGLAHYPAGRR
ncbi:MAG: DUF1499 domain-containing protein [Gemmatimonadetes bacterium]|nr:DUF1499 domain-containing protein [Gemmatimonadota bacterium]